MGPLIYVFVLAHAAVQIDCILYPRESETREVRTLDGLWNFAVPPTANKSLGFYQQWYSHDLNRNEQVSSILMPVPSSYNDITQDAELRDHLGVVWYDRTFFVPKSWASQRVWLRFSSVSYAAQVWINGELLLVHEMGHLPFESELGEYLLYGQENRVTVACDNTLLPTTVPQGNVQEVNTDNGKKYIQTYTFDFFNYAGIHRSVHLYTTPQQFIEDVSVVTVIDQDGETGVVYYNVSSRVNNAVRLTLYDRDGQAVASEVGTPNNEGTLKVPNAKLWWPYLMDPEPGYLYTMEVELFNDDNDQIVDVYRLKVGIREVTWSNTSLYMNGKPVYLHGFGKHEDSDIRGKGLDFPVIIKDFNLIKWVGGNTFRTSHYPYAEEIMDLADETGIMVIDECPSVDTDLFSSTLLEKHKSSLTQLIARDKNHPSVIAWSIANEPRTQTKAAGEYFGKVANHTRKLDPRRPITLAVARGVSEDQSGQHMDFISFNRYNAWYSNPGHLDMVTLNVIKEATQWHEKYNKPVLMSEYGGDTLAGLHLYPAYIWTEEYQVALFSKHFEAFDHLRDKEWFIGEYVWNFADFKTAQTYTRVGGNNKGIFTRQRQPKAAAYHLRRRYFAIANELYNATLPNDLYLYTASVQKYHEEL